MYINKNLTENRSLLIIKRKATKNENSSKCFDNDGYSVRRSVCYRTITW